MSARRPAPGRRAGLAAAAVLAVVFLVTWLRGSRVEPAEKDPAAAGDGTTCQLLERTPGRRSVRCARVLDATPAAVWAVVRDYPRFGEIFSAPYATLSLAATTDEPGDVTHLSGTVKTVVHDWTLDLRVRHRQEGDVFVASWSEPPGAMIENHGAWTVRPAPGGGTLLAYELEAAVPRVPRFLVNGALLAQIPYPIARVADAVRARARP